MMFNTYDFNEQTEWTKQGCLCPSCKEEIEDLKERCLLAEGEIVSVTDFVDTFNKIKEGEEAIITISDDLTITNQDKITIPSKSKVTVNLNNKKITLNNNDILFRVDGELIIDGGSFEGDGYVASANEGSKVTVKGGDYKSDVTCFQANGGTLLIEGGYFNVISEKYGTKYTLNHIDALKDKGLIKVTGGKFVNYNPSNSESENPPMNFVAKGYKVIETIDGENTIYEVVKE